jgi:hypothetical protein
MTQEVPMGAASGRKAGPPPTEIHIAATAKQQTDALRPRLAKTAAPYTAHPGSLPGCRTAEEAQCQPTR